MDDKSNNAAEVATEEDNPMKDSTQVTSSELQTTGEFVPAEFVSVGGLDLPAAESDQLLQEKGSMLSEPGAPGPAPGSGGLAHYINLAQLLSVKSWLASRRQNIRPWGSFVNTARARKPRSPQQLLKRVVRNVDYFQSNYLFVFLGLFLYCVLTSPMLLVALAASLGACYILSLRNRETKIHILGRELTLAQQYAGVAICSIPVFWWAGAGSVIFWIIGASCLTIALHAALYSPEDENPEDLFEMPAGQVETV